MIFKRKKFVTKLSSVFAVSLLLTVMILLVSGGATKVYASINFGYTGDYQAWTVPQTGTYKLEVWGAEGGYGDFSGVNRPGGKGGYSSGEITLTTGETFYIYVGGQGQSLIGSGISSGGWNGGGDNQDSRDNYNKGAGGGATDIRISPGNWDNINGLNSRLIVAGGGGGGNGATSGGAANGGAGGGEIGQKTPSHYQYSDNWSNNDGEGGTQTRGGNISASPTTSGTSGSPQPGSFGKGGSMRNGNNSMVGAGGGGWFGGASGYNHGGGGGGGSAYVLTSDSYKPSGYSPTNKYYMSNTHMISGNLSLPNPNGGTEIGHSGNGYAKITSLNTQPTVSVSSPTANQKGENGEIIRLTGYAKDQEATGNLAVYYRFDNRTEQLVLNQSATGTNQSFDVNIPIPSDLSYGNHQLIVWAKDNEQVESSKMVIPIFLQDTIKPSLTHSMTSTTLAKNNTVINVTATDKGSGIKRIQLPNGNYVNASTVSYTVDKNEKYTFLAEDNAGNTETYTVEVDNLYTDLVLTSKSNTKDNTIELNWNNPFGLPSTYVLYRKNGNGEWESIPSKASVKVLNIYPDQGIPNTGLSGGQIDLDGKSVPNSGILKTWLLKEGIDSVEIDTLSLSSFNADPSKHIKEIDGIWNYDAVFYGMWNLSPDVIYPNDKAVDYLRDYIKDGGGFMTSHHTIGYTGLSKGVNKLAPEMGIEIFSNQPYNKCPGYAGRDSNGNLYPTVSFELIENVSCDLSSYWPTGSQVQIVKKGFLTEYPFKVGEIGQTYTIPSQHGLNIFGKGEVWLQTAKPTGFGGMPFKEITTSPSTGAVGTNNFYVHTYNNTAIINSGHSFPSISETETRIIANTLYYLAQTTTDTSWIDRMGMDTAIPKEPTVQLTSDDSKGASFHLTSEDFGTPSEFLLKARNSKFEVQSNVAKAELKTGIKGYSYVIDTQANTIPDNIVESTSQDIHIPNNTEFYLHVVAVDNAGNKSPVSTYHYVDTILPTLNLAVTQENWTKEVAITARAFDAESGVKRIQLPNGNWVNGETTTYTVQSNGTYTFVAEDHYGNQTTKMISINNIDRTKPTVSHTLSTSGFTDSSIVVNVTAIDNESGIKSIRLPNGTVVTGRSATFTATKNGDYAFLVEDNVGNVENHVVTVSNKTYKPTLTATPVPEEDYMKLNWTMEDEWQGYKYMINKKKSTESDYQTIPAKNNVKVLNVYPRTSSTTTFTGWDGETKTIPTSASIEKWMEAPNSENPKGYGKGLIDVDTVSIPEFNQNPSLYLKNPDGSWKYDVVFEGALDGNGFREEDDYSQVAVDSLKEWIADGQGYLSGHDTIMYPSIWNTNANQLRDMMNIKVRTLDPVANGIGSIGSSSGTVTVNVKNKGFLTNYPWDIGDINTPLTVPASHNSGQVAYGNVWLDYTNFSGRMTDSNGEGQVNFYLSTWNNTAMIQTGHLSGQATPDEQKVLANTLFYLAQTTQSTTWDDHTSQDVNEPNKPTIQNVVADGVTKKVNVDFTSVVDNGTTYHYYIEATGQKNGAKTTSDVQTATIKTGVEGYSIVVDANPNTIPDRVIETKTNSFTLTNPIEGNFYVHVVALDKVGNMSEVSHFYYADKGAPSLSIVSDNTAWTKGSVRLTATASDKETAVKRIKQPGGTWVNGNTATFSVSTNGTYTFVAEDLAGNQTSKSITVSNIDTLAPTVPSISNVQEWIKTTPVPVTITAGTDMHSGVNRVEYKLEGATVKGWTTYSEALYVSNEGETKIVARTVDNLEQSSREAISYVRIDTSVPYNTSITIMLKP